MEAVLRHEIVPNKRLQRVKGAARISVAHIEGKSRLGRLYQQGAAKIRLPKTHNGPALDAVLINISGGVTGGDRLDWSIDIGKNARAVMTTQACEKVYRAASDTARITVGMKIGGGAALSWLPQETILFDRSALSRELNVELAKDAALLLVEPVIFGRRAMNEVVHQASFLDRWRIYRGGQVLHAEDTRLQGDVLDVLRRPATMAGASAIATVLLVHPNAADMIEPVRAMLGKNAGASAIRNSAGERLVVRMIAESGLDLRRQLVPVIDWCNRKLTGAHQGLPKLWNT
ncbi:urease accessory protein UreD [Hoeflea prorocentri]|uniref:Urease accessory protein UreD n=1 Tax=Hoeflea prorocentri TaxID=1922333 RepID=A0A9X3UEF7_9HYPH|nr:urease accessory protein UreD [Hoeflea prorocentri]MCY6379148.1 urease accessory protein UreD [Hoeflea prorocentri]MDA5396949.1 urease accessory protein UreD [Hoeflea prorocentri]